MSGTDDVHALSPDEFHERVHSFEHWFGAVEGYLGDLRHGHRADLEDPPLEKAQRERLISTLCNYAVGETAALEASSGLIRIAPGHHAKIFLSTQVVDEGRHVEVILDRMRELGVEDPEQEVERRASAAIKNFKDQLLRLVDAGEWDAAIFAQNVVLESMEFTVFHAHARVADPVTADLLERIIKDERRHIGFGENELGRRMRQDPRRRLWLQTIRREFDPIVLETLETTARDLGIPRSEGVSLGQGYQQAVRRLGFE